MGKQLFTESYCSLAWKLQLLYSQLPTIDWTLLNFTRISSVGWNFLEFFSFVSDTSSSSYFRRWFKASSSQIEVFSHLFQLIYLHLSQFFWCSTSQWISQVGILSLNAYLQNQMKTQTSAKKHSFFHHSYLVSIHWNFLVLFWSAICIILF